MNLIISSRARLLAKYGPAGLASITASGEQLRQAWLADEEVQSAYFAYVDDAASLAPLGLPPLTLGEQPGEAEAKAIAALLDALEARGQQIEHLLILGGPTVIPFFNLENPVIDVDTEVLSDNPYGQRGDDDVLPDRYVGRMPDAVADASPMLQAMQTAIEARSLRVQARQAAQKPAPTSRPGCWHPFAGSGGDKGLPTGRATMPLDAPHSTPTLLSAAERNARAFGYSAEIWQNSSRLIYQTVTRVDGGEELRICPPTNSGDFQSDWLANRFLYFNLHGVIDNSPWFGQSVPSGPAIRSDYPVAMRPEQVKEGEPHIRQLAPFVFSECCYGAYISDKATAAAICLQFMASGAAVFVGSTVTSYGRPDPPLSEADLLAALFFEHLYNGMTAGRALVESRRDYVRTMLQQHGMLDDDDVKTLREFVLYGDPTLRAW